MFPVIEPELLEFPKSTSIEVDQGSNINFTCTIQAGMNAQVWWTVSGGDPIQSETQRNSSFPPVGPMLYADSNVNESGQYMVLYSSVLYLHNFSSQLAGVYACIVDDPGYPNNTVHEEYSIVISLRLPSTIAPTVSIQGICNELIMYMYI